MSPDAPSRLGGFSHVSLSVADLDASIRFYVDVLGLRVMVPTYDGVVFRGRETILSVPGRVGLCLQEHAANDGSGFVPTRSGLDHLAFAVESLEELHRWIPVLDEAGVQHSEVKELPGFGSMIEMRDPDGILVELHALGS